MSSRALSAIVVVCAACAAPSTTDTSSLAIAAPDHIVIVIEENKAFSEIIGNPAAPYINQLASQGALFTRSYAIEHPSQPNYLDLFSGGNQGVHDDSCPHTFNAPNLGTALIDAGWSFGAYSEDLPGTGSSTCQSGQYFRKHAPWTNFSNLAAATGMRLADLPGDFSQLPSVAFVIPNQDDDMHDGSIQQGDGWLKTHLASYVSWAQTHNSLLIVTFDEDDSSQSNQISTLFVGPMVRQMRYRQPISHFKLLRTLLDLYHLAPFAAASNERAIDDVWNEPADPNADWRHTVVFVHGVTSPGQDMFVRGGIDYDYARTHLGRDCDANPRGCRIPIRHRNLKNATTAGWKHDDNYLDWLGPDVGQDPAASGSPLDWTTDLWPPAWGTPRTVDADGYGITPLDTWGPHEWMLDVDVDCHQTVDGWFEVKSFISNGPGWEADVAQPGAPYASHNHFARCGEVNRFVRDSAAAEAHPF